MVTIAASSFRCLSPTSPWVRVAFDKTFAQHPHFWSALCLCQAWPHFSTLQLSFSSSPDLAISRARHKQICISLREKATIVSRRQRRRHEKKNKKPDRGSALAFTGWLSECAAAGKMSIRSSSVSSSAQASRSCGGRLRGNRYTL